MSVSESVPKSDHPKWMSREQMAWSVLLVAFATFVFLAISIPLLANWYLQSASVAQFAVIQGSSGKTLVEVDNSRADPVAVEGGRIKNDVTEGSTIRTDDSQAVITLFDRSTLTIFPNSTVRLNVMRQPRFSRSQQSNHITLTVHGGRIRVQVASNSGRDTRFEVHTPQALAPHGGIVLSPGSYSIESSPETTHVAVRLGEAAVSGQTGQPITLQSSERAEIELGMAAVGPLPANRNLLINGDFQNLEHANPISEGQLVEGWWVRSDQGGDGGDVDGTVEVVITGTSRALHFTRNGSNNNHGKTAVVQEVDQLVADYLSLVLRFDVKLDYQSLSGGGEQSSEFPIIVRVDYRDQNGNPQHWTHGFYYQNNAGFNIINGTQIPQGAPFRFEQELKAVLNDPQTIESIEFYASGWDWDAHISEVELVAE